MKYLPYESITYKTSLLPTEILKLIQENIKPSREGTSTEKDRNNSYKGKIIGQSFEIKREINYRNSFLPIIKGEVKQVAEESIINVKMTLNPIVLIFFIFWFGGITLAFLSVLFASTGNGQISALILGPIGMIIFGYGLITGGFKYESIKSKKYLTELFKAEIVQ